MRDEKPAIVVAGRSYGRSLMMVNRGPQLVHEMNGWRYRRSAGSASSRRQSAHVATSGAASVRVPPLRLDSAIVKPVPPRTGSVVDRIDSIAASGGASARNRVANSATASASPSTSMTTPPSSLPTEPVSSNADAVT